MITTLNEIDEDGYELPKVLERLGKTYTDDEPLLISTILEINGLNDAVWCLRYVRGCSRELRLFSVGCARQVEHLTKYVSVIECNNVAERYANGLATRAELAAALKTVKVTLADSDSDMAVCAAAIAARDLDVDTIAATSAARHACEAVVEKQAAELLRICKQWEEENL